MEEYDNDRYYSFEAVVNKQTMNKIRFLGRFQAIEMIDLLDGENWRIILESVGKDFGNFLNDYLPDYSFTTDISKRKINCHTRKELLQSVDKFTKLDMSKWTDYQFDKINLNLKDSRIQQFAEYMWDNVNQLKCLKK